MCFLAFSHHFLSKATDHFSHMLQQRWEAKKRRKEISPQPGIELTTSTSWVRHAHHWDIRAGRDDFRLDYSQRFIWTLHMWDQAAQVLCYLTLTFIVHRSCTRHPNNFTMTHQQMPFKTTWHTKHFNGWKTCHTKDVVTDVCITAEGIHW